ncbi:hypothetical protein [Parapedobacter sp. DT-150]|uniref:hypothetical protein n=1 Tax=Parapedobacter sp. DT-150 TaxID=3396162 RepID=UPI003F196225
MKPAVLIHCIFFLLMFASCEKLEFYGDTFYTVTGKITGEGGRAILLAPLQLYATKAYTAGIWDGTRRQLTATGKTGLDGTFQITFPKSNGQHYLLMEGYQVVDSLGGFSECPSCIQVDVSNAIDYVIDVDLIHVTEP